MVNKILILTGSISRETGGMHSYLYGLCEAFSKENIDFELCIIDGDVIDQRFLKFKKKIKSFKFYFFKKFYFSPNLFSHVLNSNYNFIYLHGAWASTSILTLLKHFFHKTKYIVVPHGMYCGNLSIIKKFALIWERKLVNNALFVQALNTVESFCIKSLFPTAQISVIYPGLNVNDSTSNSIVNPIVLPENYFLYIGQLHPRKNLINVIKAWDLFVSNYNNNFTLVIVGFGDEHYTKSVLNQIKISKQILYYGPAFGYEKELLFKNAFASLLFSYSEGLPTSLIESIYYNTPILCSINCNVLELFDSIDDNLIHFISSGTSEFEIYNTLTSFYKMNESQKLSYLDKLKFDFNKKINWLETIKIFKNEI